VSLSRILQKPLLQLIKSLILVNPPKSNPTARLLDRPGGRTVAISFDDGFQSMYTKLLPLSREFNYPITLFVYTDNVYSRAEKSITWRRLRELDAGGVTVESHTISHADLVRLYARNTQESRKKIFDEKDVYGQKKTD